MAETRVVDFSTAEFLADPYPTYRWLRENAPVHFMPFKHGQGGMWLVSRYDDVMAAVKEPRLSKDFSRVAPEETLMPMDISMLFRDPPDHMRLRGLVSLAFTPRRIEQLRPRIATIIDGLLEEMASKKEVDFIADFALPLPVVVIAELLGVPAEDGARFRAWSETIITATDGARATAEMAEAAQRAQEALAEYLGGLMAERRREPQHDLISALLQARDGEQALSEEELLGTCVLLLIAGHETTVNLLGNGMLLLLRHPEQMALLREQRDLMNSAIEEMLRYESPVQRSTPRFATAPLTIAGQVIEPGQQVSGLLGSANRDPAQFPDADRFDVCRTPNRHLAFGFGIHFCLGAPLARAEASLAFRRLLDTFSCIELLDEEPNWRVNTFMRGLGGLRVEVRG